MCFVRITEQTVIISLYCINWLVFVTETESVYCTLQDESLYIYFRLFRKFRGLRYSHGEFANYEASGHYMYSQFNIQQSYVMPTQCVYVFCVDLRTNSDYFPIQH
jgi:hypothetical protein